MPELLRLEQTHFPVIEGEHHAGFVFRGDETNVLIEAHDSARWFVSVAEGPTGIVGFANAAPFPLPGQPNSRLDPGAMLLTYLAVDPKWRRGGTGKRLLAHIESRARTVKQDIIVAHVPPTSRGFYDSVGWRTYGVRTGYAWQPHLAEIRADKPDPRLGYPHMAVRVLRPERLSFNFSFPLVTGNPWMDAMPVVLNRMINGSLDERAVSPTTHAMMRAFATSEVGRTSRGAFGQRL